MSSPPAFFTPKELIELPASLFLSLKRVNRATRQFFQSLWNQLFLILSQKGCCMKKMVKLRLTIVLTLLLASLINPAITVRHQIKNSAIPSPILGRQASNDTDSVNHNFQEYTQCPNNDLLALSLFAGNAVTRFGFFTSRRVTISLLKAQHLLM